MIAKRFEAIVFGFLLSGLMSLIVSGIATLRVLGITSAFPAQWLASWIPSWAIAFPTVLVVAPLVRRIVARLVRSTDMNSCRPPRADPGRSRRSRVALSRKISRSASIRMALSSLSSRNFGPGSRPTPDFALRNGGLNA